MKRLCGILLALAGLFLYAPCAAQNTRVRGTVTDAQTGEPIPYAVVLFPGTTTGITTDDEGFYSLESRDTSSYIRAEMVSYEPQIRPIPAGSDNRVDFRLNPTHLEIGNVVVTPGDNPAHPILAGIVRNKKYNDPEEYDRYICRTYTKMELGLANVREFRSRKLQQNFGFIFEHIDTSDVTGQPYLPVMISETAADYYHSRTPTVAREVIRASQISGIEDNSMLAQFTGHLHADVNLYENFIDLFGVKFASPLSNSGRSFYKYFLVDSTNVEGRKTYKIRFHPKSVATPVLDGEVNIDSASYALRSARVKMAKGVNVNWIRHLAIEADNRLTADSLWFPQREKMTADFTLTKSDSSKMIAFLGSREVTYSDVKFDTPIPKQVLGTSANVILSDDAISGKRVEWDSLRPYALSQKENDDYLNQQREQTLRSILSWDHLRKKWKVGVKAGYIHTWMAYDYERELGNGKMEKMIRSRSTINTFFGQVDGEYYLGEKWLFTATVSAHQHLVRSIDKNIIPMDNQQPTDPNGNKTKVPVGYDKGRIELSGYVSIRYRPTERLGLSIGLREEMFGSEWTPIIPAFFTDYLISKRGNLVAKASISRNYRFPSLNDLYFLPGGNPDLKKEHGFTYDAGLSFATGRDGVYTLRGEATWFDSYIDNWIVWLPTAKGFWTPKNVKEVHAYGVEVKAGLDVQLAKDWQLSADGNFSWTPSINHGDPVDWYDKAIGKQLVYIPEFSASVTGHLTYRSWRFTYKWCYYSERFTTSDNDMKTKIGRVKPYFMSDISLEKAFSFRWADLSLKGVINNLFNEEYQSVLSRPMPRLNYEIFLDIRPKWGKRNKKQ